MKPVQNSPRKRHGKARVRAVLECVGYVIELDNGMKVVTSAKVERALIMDEDSNEDELMIEAGNETI